MWRQVYLPCIRLVLQPTRMCFRVTGARQWRQAGSSPNQRCRLVEEGRTSYVAPMVKPCLAWDTALAHMSTSSRRRTSSTTRCQHKAGVAFCHVGGVVPKPKPTLPCWTWPTMSLCFREDFACDTATPGLHLLPVAKVGAAPLIKGSRDSVRVISSLALEHLYSSTRLEIGRERAPLPYRPMLLRHLGSSSHFFYLHIYQLLQSISMG